MLQIAKVLKSNGTDGSLILSFRDCDPDEININEPVFIVFDELPVPFFFDSFTPKGVSRALAHFVDIDTLEDAEELVGRAVFSDSIEVEEDSEDLFDEVKGWTLCDPRGAVLGIIADIEDIPGNPCLVVEKTSSPQKEEVLVPFHEDFICGADSAARILSVNLPDGLL